MSASFDRQVVDWIHEGPEQGSRESLERALAATRGVAQRPGWTFLERWLPVQLTMQRVVIPRAIYLMLLVVLLAVALVVAAIIGAPKELPPPFGPAANGLVAFDAGGAVYVAQSDGSGARAVDVAGRYAFTPTFSRDGTKLAFWAGDRATSNVQDLYVVGADGGSATKINGDVRFFGRLDAPIAWSADGTTIAFAGMAPRRIVLAATDGSGVRPLFENADPEGIPWTPVYSPDGDWLAYRTDRGNESQLIVARADGSGGERVLVTGGRQTDDFTSIQWGPGSDRLVYHRANIVEIVDLDGTITTVSDPAWPAADPSWSPDGQWLAFNVEVEEVRHVELVRPDGSGARNIGAAGGCVLTWSPDSAYLFGFTDNCFSSKLIRIPVDDPDAAVVFDIPGDIGGQASWQRVAVER